MSRQGYTDLGRTPRKRPPIVQIQDRVTGQWWTLGHRTADERITLNDFAVRRYFQGYIVRYPAFDGPRVTGQERWRWFVDNGQLGIEEVARPIERQHPLASWNDNDRYALVLTDGTLEAGGTAGWTLLYDDRA